MKKFIAMVVVATMLLGSLGCGNTNVNVNVENQENLNSASLGASNLTSIGDGLYYDTATRIVYIKIKPSGGYAGYMSPYCAPNGLPYRYNASTNTFEEIENNCNCGCYLTESVESTGEGEK